MPRGDVLTSSWAGIKAKWVSSSTQPGPRPFPGLPARCGPRGSQRQGQLPKLHRKDPTACRPPPALPQAQPHLSPVFSRGAQHCPLLHSSHLWGQAWETRAVGPKGVKGRDGSLPADVLACSLARCWTVSLPPTSLCTRGRPWTSSGRRYLAALCCKSKGGAAPTPRPQAEWMERDRALIPPIPWPR